MIAIPPAARKADLPLEMIADYVSGSVISHSDAFETALYCLADALGCAVLSLKFPECKKLLGPVVPGTSVPNGSRVPGTEFILDPIQAAFNIGTMIRWLDYNDTWLAAEWGHPSDNLGGILAVADYLSRVRSRAGKLPLTMRDVLIAMIKAYEIQGWLSLLNSFNRIGLDHVIYVKVATSAVIAGMLGADRGQIIDAISNAWIDLGPLRTYRHYPNTGSRKSWAAGDATSRGVMLALIVLRGEMGYPTALSAEKWGLYDVLFQGKPFAFEQPLGSYVIENILFKVAFPAEFHAQTAIECALKLHPLIVNRLNEIDRIEIITHESAMRIINKTGVLNNPADRDHCLQYMVAVALLFGELKAEHYEDIVAEDPRIDELRKKMCVREEFSYSRNYLDPEKRAIPNAIQIFFKDGSKSERVEVEYPLGHRKRRREGIPLLLEKFKNNLETGFSSAKVEEIIGLFADHSRLNSMPVDQFLDIVSHHPNIKPAT